ncbi:MAG: ribonuclease Z [Bacteroidales bacterium]|nr:ribonuclease Z [Bacteroidales bacterium]
MKTFTLTILGTSSAVPTSKRYTSAHVLNVCEHYYLFDCGEATQIRLRQENIPLSKIYHIFISHLHGDHFFGIFGLLSSFQLHRMITDVYIYAHKPLQKIIQTVLNFEEVHFNLHFIPLNEHEYEQIYEDKHVRIFSFPLLHRIPVSAFIVKQKEELLKIRKEKITEYNLSIKDIVQIKQGHDWIDSNGNRIPNDVFTFPPEKPKIYAYITDTIYNEQIIPHIFNADVLYHEATFTEKYKDRALLSGHSTAKQAATIALKAQAKRLIIGHFSVRYKHRNEFLEEARQIFPDTILAEEGLTISF